MDFTKSVLENIDPEVAERFVSRREAVSSLGKLGAGLALASVPVSIGLMAKSSFAKGGIPQDVTSVLNFALTLEYLEAAFYNKGLASGNLVPNSDFAIFTQIAKHENEHVAALKAALGSSAVSSPTFDFTAKGAFPDVFTNYQTFLALSQAFEDTGVRAYKGQAANLMSSPDTLEIALRIHSVEARHASEVRRLRGEKGWIEGTSNTLPSAAAAVYQGEDNTSQAGVNIQTAGSVSAAAASASFDEPLTMNEVLAIASLFIK